VAPLLLPRDTSRGIPAEISPYYFGVRETRGRKQLDGRFVTRKTTRRRRRKTNRCLEILGVALLNLIARGGSLNERILGENTAET